jgi:hypothetical protein
MQADRTGNSFSGMAGQEASLHLAIRALCHQDWRSLVATLFILLRGLRETRTPIAIGRSASNYVRTQEILNVTFVA